MSDSIYNFPAEEQAADNRYSDARIPEQLGYMNEQLGILGKMISELRLKLDRIMLPDLDDEKKMLEVPMPPGKPTSELSSTIDDLNSQILEHQRRISDTIRRIQL